MDTRIGKQMGNYHLTRLLGSGSFADVFLGQHVYLDAPAAIKVLKKGSVREHVQQFINEARTLKLLTHSNIVRVLDFGITEDEIPYLVMDYASNGTLRKRHPRGAQVPLDIIVSYAKQVGDALQYAHDQKKIHRDVKPENMLLNEKNEVLLSDFGLVEIARTSMSLTHPTVNRLKKDVAGTPLYMAPEQFRARPRPASDQYALGVVVYEWLSGEPPFTGSLYALEHQHRCVFPPPLQGKIANVTPALEAVVMKALAKEPEQRFASVQDFAQALDKAYQGAVSPSQDQLFISIYRKEPVERPSQSQLQAMKEIQNISPRPSYTTLKVQQTNQFPQAEEESSSSNQHIQTPSITIPPNQPLQDGLNTFLPIHDSFQDRERQKQNVQRDWINLKWFILVGAIMTSLFFPIGILFQIPIVIALSLIPVAICIIPGLFQTAYHEQWYWFIGFVLLCPLTGILYFMMDPQPKLNPQKNLKQLIILLASLSYAFIAVAFFMNSWSSTSNVNTWWIYYLGGTLMLSSWLLGFIRTTRLIGFGEWILVFFFPMSAPFAGIISVYSKDMQLDIPSEESDEVIGDVIE